MYIWLLGFFLQNQFRFYLVITLPTKKVVTPFLQQLGDAEMRCYSISLLTTVVVQLLVVVLLVVELLVVVQLVVYNYCSDRHVYS